MDLKGMQGQAALDRQPAITLPLACGASLEIGGSASSADGYPTGSLQKGFRLAFGGQDLAEEGVGFGVPVVKRGLQAFFPGSLELGRAVRGTLIEVRAAYTLNLAERFTAARSARVKQRGVYAVKELLATVHRHVRPLRSPLTSLSNALRSILGWQTSFEEVDPLGVVTMTCLIDASLGNMVVEADATGLDSGKVTELVLMNEQGARSFDRYSEPGKRVLCRDEIGSWEEVTAEAASFVCSTHGLSFGVAQVPAARLYRGWELVGSRLAWAGFGYSMRPCPASMSYGLRIGRVA